MNNSLSDTAVLIPGILIGVLSGGWGASDCAIFSAMSKGNPLFFVDVPASLPLPNNDGLRQEQAPYGVGNLELEMSDIRDGNSNKAIAIPSHPDSTGSEGGIVDVVVESAQEEEAGVSATVNEMRVRANWNFIQFNS